MLIIILHRFEIKKGIVYNIVEIWGYSMNDVELLNDLAIKKIKMANDEPIRFLVRSIMAGFYLGAAMILSYSLAALLHKNFLELSKIALAATFGIGLVAIVFLGAELFTGNCFTTIIPVYDGKIKLKELVRPWLLCLLGNAVGIMFIGFLFIKSGSMSSLLKDYLKPIYDTKLNYVPTQLLLKSVLCNFIVCIAAYGGIKIKDDVVKVILILFFVTAFVVPGFEHCIANMGFFSMCFAEYGLAISLPNVMIHLFISIVGNIIGGTLMVGLPIYIIFKK